MEIGYAVIGKCNGEKWKSGIFYDAEDATNEYLLRLEDKHYTELKECTVYIHYEVKEEEE